MSKYHRAEILIKIVCDGRFPLLNRSCYMRRHYLYEKYPDKQKLFQLGVQHNCNEVIKYIYDKIDISGDIGNNGFLASCFYGNIEIFKLLVNDTRINVDKYGEDGIRYAIEGDHLEIVKILMNNSNVWTYLFREDILTFASKCNKYDVVQFLLGHHKINPVLYFSGSNALYFAIQNKNTEIVRILTNDSRIKISFQHLDDAKNNCNSVIIGLVEAKFIERLNRIEYLDYYIKNSIAIVINNFL